MLLFVLLAVFIGGPDGRPHARVPRQEDRGARDQAACSARCSRRWPCCCHERAAIATQLGATSIFASGPQGFSENLYAYLSQANNNGSAWAGYTGYVQPEPGNLGAGITFADLLGGLTMVARALRCRSSSCSPSPARWPASASRPPGSGTMRTDTPTFVVAADRRDRARRRAHLLPRLPARTGRPEPDHEPLLMRRTVTAVARRRSASPSCFGLAYPLVVTGVAQVAFPGKADGSKIERDGCSRLAATRTGLPTTRATSSRAVDGHELQRRRRRVHQPRPEQQGRPRHVQGARGRLPRARAAVTPRPDRRRRARRRGHQLGVGRRPAHLRGQRRDPGAPHRRRPPAPARARPRS